MTDRDDRLDAMDKDQIKNMSDDAKKALNADPITGEPGSHPVGTGIGAAAGAAIGAAIGSVIPGPGTVAGAAAGTVIAGAVGAVVGGLAGKAGGEAADPTDEDAYWRANHTGRPYYRTGTDYDADYAPAYGLGTAARTSPDMAGRSFEDAEPTMKQRWETTKEKSSLTWDEAKQAARDSWNRLTK